MAIDSSLVPALPAAFICDPDIAVAVPISSILLAILLPVARLTIDRAQIPIRNALLDSVIFS